MSGNEGVVTATGSWSLLVMFPIPMAHATYMAWAPSPLVCCLGCTKVSDGVVRATGMGGTPLGVFQRQWVVALSFRCCLWLSEVDWEEGGVGILMNIHKYTTTNDEFHPSFVVWLPCCCQRHGTWILYERCEWGEVSCSPWLLVTCVCSWVLASFVFISGPSSSFGWASSFVGGCGWLLVVW